eukprot:6491569-Amphidinium_carterae.4
MYKKALDEEIKIGVLAYLAPEKVSEHPFPSADKLQTYADARKVVFEFLDAQGAACRRCGCAHGRRRPHCDTGKGGNGKGGKGRKHGSPDANNGNKTGKEKFAGECWVCGKTGHISSECWYKDKKGKDGGKGAKKGKGKGKGKATGSLEETAEEQST